MSPTSYNSPRGGGPQQRWAGGNQSIWAMLCRCPRVPDEHTIKLHSAGLVTFVSVLPGVLGSCCSWPVLMLVLSSGLLNCGDAHKASDRAKAEFVGSIIILVFNITIYTNFMQYMWRKGKATGRKHNPAKPSVYLLMLALILLAVDPLTTTLRHLGWEAFSNENLPRAYACEGEGASKKCNKKTLFGYFVWASTLAGLLVMGVAMWQYTVTMGNNCVATAAYDISKAQIQSQRGPGRRPEGEAAMPMGPDLENPPTVTESTGLLAGRGDGMVVESGRGDGNSEEEEEPAGEPAVTAEGGLSY